MAFVINVKILAHKKLDAYGSIIIDGERKAQVIYGTFPQVFDPAASKEDLLRLLPEINGLDDFEFIEAQIQSK